MNDTLDELLDSAKIVGIDTNIWIYVFEAHEIFGKKSLNLLHQVEKGQVHGVMSAVSLAEILVKPLREGNDSLEKQYKVFLMHFPNLHIQSVDASVAEKAALLRSKYQLKMPDAFIVASALAAGAELFITNDQRLEQIQELKVVSIGT